MNRYSLLIIVGVMVCYELAVEIVDKPIILPSILLIFTELYRIIFSSSFVSIIWVTLVRTMMTFSCVFIISLILGVFSGYFKIIRLLLSPIVTFLRTGPTISVTIILLIWFGRDLGPIMIMALVIFPLLYELIGGAINDIDSDLLDVCLLFGATHFETFKALYYPQLLKILSSGVQATIGLSFKVMVMAEVMGQSQVGIGQQLNYEKTYLNMPAVFAWTIVLILLVMFFEIIIGYLIKRLIRHLDA